MSDIYIALLNKFRNFLHLVDNLFDSYFADTVSSQLPRYKAPQANLLSNTLFKDPIGHIGLHYVNRLAKHLNMLYLEIHGHI